MEALYFESHITAEPVFETELDRFKAICEPFRFRVADLLMQKRAKDTPERSVFDTFCTGRGKDVEELTTRMLALVRELRSGGFRVWRYKLELAVIDSRVDDTLLPLPNRKAG